MNTLNNLPSPSTPFLGADGRISQVWWQLLVSLFSRTGSELGFDFGAALQRIADVEAENAALVAQNAVLTAQAAALAATNAALQIQVNAIPLPAGYSKALAAGVVRKIPYYSN